MSESTRDPREGRLEQVEDGWRLRFERVLPHRPEKVWRAITEEEHLAAWFPTTIEGELKPGAPLLFRFRGEELRPHGGEVIACEPPHLLEFTWGFAKEDLDPSNPEDAEILEHYAGIERSRFVLTPEREGCRLTFTTTYEEVGKSARDAAGWHVCFEMLEDHLAGRPSAPHTPDRWKPLNRLYTQRFGAHAATIGPPPTEADYLDS